jgi:hypothetical protein
MQSKSLKHFLLSLIFIFMSTPTFAEEELQDMSDILAVYTQAGIGYTDKGINIKIGQAYDSGKPSTMAMNVLEIKGIYGDALGTREPLNKS